MCLEEGLNFEGGSYPCSVDMSYMVTCRVVVVDEYKMYVRGSIFTVCMRNSRTAYTLIYCLPNEFEIVRF